ncbi:MAG: (Fe-S)-binding protein, partial [Clostridia bacterium]
YLPVTKSKLKDYGMTRKDVLWETEPEIVDIMQVSKDRGEAMRLLGEIEKVNKLLPQLDCGNCGAPSCRAFAEDVVLENVDINNCTKLNET